MKKISIILLIMGLIIVIVSCNTKKKRNYSVKEKSVITQKETKKDIVEIFTTTSGEKITLKKNEDGSILLNTPIHKNVLLKPNGNKGVYLDEGNLALQYEGDNFIIMEGDGNITYRVVVDKN